MAPRSYWSCGRFFVLVTEGAGMSELEGRHYLRNGGETLPDAREALEWAAETRVSMVDLKFCDLLGTWQHMTLPLGAFDESAFEDGLGFDGSSIRGWQGISESDMLLMPRSRARRSSTRATEVPTLSLICEIADPITREPYTTRSAPGRQARRGVPARRPGSPTPCYFGPECEFFVFDEVSYDLGPNDGALLRGRLERRATGTPASRASATRSAPKEGYFPPAPHDTLQRPAHARWC